MKFISERGAPLELFSDCAKEACSKEVEEILRMMMIRRHKRSEPYQQNQDPAERAIGDVERQVNVVMDRTGTPAPFWLLCTLYIASLFCVISQASLQGKTAFQHTTGQVPDISPYLNFHWWERVSFLDDNPDKMTDSMQRAGRFVGVAKDVGDHLTYWILDEETMKVIPRSVVAKRDDPANPNLRLDTPTVSATADGEAFVYTQDGIIEAFNLSDKDEESPVTDSGERSPGETVESDESSNPSSNPNRPQTRSQTKANPSPSNRPKLPYFSPEDLIDRSFLYDAPNRQRLRAVVKRKLDTLDAQNHQNIKFLLHLGKEEAEEVIDYVKLNDIFEALVLDEVANPQAWPTYKEILSHAGPYTNRSPEWRGSKFNVLVLWDDGEVKWEPLNQFGKDDPVSCADYARDHGLLETDGWKFLQKHARRDKLLKRKIKAAKSAQSKRGPRYKFGVRIPRDWREARSFQEEAGHTKWTDAEQVEIDNLFEYDTFKDLGKGDKQPKGHQKIRTIWVYDCKHDFRHRARMVAGGHLTPEADDAYSSVVSLEIMRYALVIGELNGLKPMVGDIGNAYLEAYTKEKVYFVAGPEFGHLEGHSLLIVKALYGLRTSGARFHERLADALRDEGFKPSLADPDLWLRDTGDCYEYICVWVDDLLAILKDPEAFYEALRSKYQFKLKGVGQPEYHLGGNFGRDPDGTLYWGARTYVEKLLGNYERMFGGPPKKYSSPLDKDDHPELDQSPLLRADGVKMYQSLVGALQWAITLARFDIACGVACLSRFRAEPREGHLDRVKRVCGYLRNHPDAAIRFRVNWPENEAIFGEQPEFDWMYSVYGEPAEDELALYPPPKGRMVRLTTWKDANLMHCKVTGKSCSGILHFINQTPVKWFSKLQDTVEAATFGSESMSGRIATDHIIGMRASLKAMGVPIEKTSWMLGDNQSVITQSTVPSSTLTKRHNALAYHRIRWAVATKVIKFVKVDGKENVADPLTKYMNYTESMPLIKPLLFWRGETLIEGDLGAGSRSA